MRNVKKVIILALLMAPLIFAFKPAMAGEKTEKNQFFGFSAFGGEQIKDEHLVNSFWHTTGNHEWKYWMLHPTYGLVMSDDSRWELYLEGNIGYLNFHSKNDYRRYKTDTLALGASIMTSYDFLRFKKVSLFAECGVGLGYWTKSPSKKLVQPDILGLINYGVGLKVPLGNDFYLRSSFRFTHTSSIPGRDTGANTGGVMMGITKYFK